VARTLPATIAAGACRFDMRAMLLVVMLGCDTSGVAQPPVPAPVVVQRRVVPPPSLPGKRERALATVMERKAALRAQPAEPPPGADPVHPPARVLEFVDALDDYVQVAEPSDPDRPKMKFLAAATLSHWRQPDAIPRLEEILRGDRSDETVEYAANLLLDNLNRNGRYDDMGAWIDDLLADRAFLAGKDDLRETLERLHAQLLARN
jgi:hypothetical protein